MADFKDMARNAKAVHEKVVAEENQKREAEREARSKVVDAAVTALKENVMPFLAQAKSDFQAEGIDVEIKTEYDVKNFLSRNPSVSFRCVCPRVRNDGWQLKTTPVFFDSDGQRINAGKGHEPYDTQVREKLGAALLAESEPLVTTAIQVALEAYYRDLEKQGIAYGMR